MHNPNLQYLEVVSHGRNNLQWKGVSWFLDGMKVHYNKEVVPHTVDDSFRDGSSGLCYKVSFVYKTNTFRFALKVSQRDEPLKERNAIAKHKHLVSYKSIRREVIIMPWYETILDNLICTRSKAVIQKAVPDLQEFAVKLEVCLLSLLDQGFYYFDLNLKNIAITDDGLPILLDLGSLDSTTAKDTLATIPPPPFYNGVIDLSKMTVKLAKKWYLIQIEMIKLAMVFPSSFSIVYYSDDQEVFQDNHLFLQENTLPGVQHLLSLIKDYEKNISQEYNQWHHCKRVANTEKTECLTDCEL